jgi:hypothetical protein
MGFRKATREGQDGRGEPPDPGSKAKHEEGDGAWTRLRGWMREHAHRTRGPGEPMAALASGPTWPGVQELYAHRQGVAAPGGDLSDTRFAREIAKLVSCLGATPGGFAASLEHAGVRGRPGEPATSPLSRYLSAILGGDPSVKGISVEERAVVVEMRSWWRGSLTVRLPQAAVEFLAAFDAECYPALLEAPRRGCAGGAKSPGRERTRRPRGDEVAG